MLHSGDQLLGMPEWLRQAPLYFAYCTLGEQNKMLYSLGSLTRAGEDDRDAISCSMCSCKNLSVKKTLILNETARASPLCIPTAIDRGLGVQTETLRSLENL